MNKKNFPDPSKKTVASSASSTVVEMSAQEVKQRMYALFAVFGVVIFFWFSFHQNGLTLTYFAKEYTDLNLFGMPISAELFQSLNPFLSAMLTAFASVIPLVGTALVWVPITIYFLIVGSWVNALMMLGYGAIIVSQCDNLIRFLLQKKMADVHPLITIFGVVAGLPLFGFMGVIFGPLLVSLFLLFVDMFRKEFLLEDNQSATPD